MDNNQRSEEKIVEATSIFNLVAEHNGHKGVLGSLFTVNCVTVNGRMCFSVLYGSHVASKRTAMIFASKLKSKLTSL